VTPAELDLIRADGALVDAEVFASAFYGTLFELAPATRRLFGDDLVAQRGKLVDELGFLVDAATAAGESGDLSPFVDRARDLGRRHVGYGVRGPDYVPVGEALVAALAEVVDGWDDTHVQAWRKLYRLIADVMREGADRDLFSAN
jgi:hemoglobin-like flavoprotein